MPWILIKNNLKIMLRSKWILIFMCLMPSIIIGALSSVFDSMMDLDYTIEDFNVGYRVEDGNPYKQGMPELVSTAKEYKVRLIEYPQGSIEKMVKNGEADVFVEIKEDNYTLYCSDEKNAEASIVESIFSKYFYQLDEMIFLSQMVDKNINMEAKEIALAEEKLDVDPLPSAKDYYGIIQSVYYNNLFCENKILEEKDKISQALHDKLGHKIKLEGDAGKIPKNIWEVILDNAYEAVSNALKYSECNEIKVEIVVLNKVIRCRIIDDGIGSERIKDGMGISGMRQRVRKIGGTLDLDGSNDFIIRMILPVDTKMGVNESWKK